MTAAALLADAAATLAAAGVGAAEWDAERLLRHVLGWDRATLLANSDRVVGGPAVERFRALLRRRAAREPLQYILGTQAFWKHDFLVTPAVLIPRPETELLVETCLELLEGAERPVVVDVGTGSGCVALSIAAEWEDAEIHATDSSGAALDVARENARRLGLEKPIVVDVGTGSGCIALSIAGEREDAEVHATDSSGAALDVARENARRLGLEKRVTFHNGQLLEPLSGLEVHLILSNPPYVDPAEREALAPEVRDHEPAHALFPPGDALSVYRRLVPASAALLRAGGSLAVEIPPSIPGDVSRVLAEAGFTGVTVRPDLAGLPRVVFGRLPLARPARPPAVPVE